MGEKNDFTGEFEVPRNYYIDIHGGPYMFFRHLRSNEEGKCHIEVYQSLNRNQGGPSTEHLLKVGNFVIRDAQYMRVNDFLRKVRQGIEKIIDSKKETIN